MSNDYRPIVCVNCGGVIPAGAGRATYVGRVNGFKHRYSAECFETFRQLLARAEALAADNAALQARVAELETQIANTPVVFVNGVALRVLGEPVGYTGTK